MMLNDQSKPSDAVSQRYVEFEKVAFEELFGIETIYLSFSCHAYSINETA